MKFTKILGIAAAAALALTAFAGTASATTLERMGVKQSGAESFEGAAAGSILLSDTGGAFAITCTESRLAASTSVFTGTTVGGPVFPLTFKKCTTEPVTVDAAGSLNIEAISGTTNGTLRSTGAKITVPSPFGTLTCTTTNVATGYTDIGTLTGTGGAGTATMDINAVLDCGAFLPSAKWEGTYNVTGFSLGVVA